MIIFGKELKPEAATMWINLIGFMASLVFYWNVGRNFTKPSEIPENSLQSELIKVDTKLNEEIKQLQRQQDSLLRVISAHEIKVEQTQAQVRTQKARIVTTIHSNWDTLSQKQREDYTNRLILKLKNKKP